MSNIEGCQGQGCVRKNQCDRRVHHDWPFYAVTASKLCDARYVAFIHKPQAAWDVLEPDHKKAIAEARDALRKVPAPKPPAFVLHDGKGGVRTITEAETFF